MKEFLANTVKHEQYVKVKHLPNSSTLAQKEKQISGLNRSEKCISLDIVAGLFFTHAHCHL